ncbi:MAG: ABC transporter ATP-binding protein [Deltaproteobacteria bacterium]|nr:ABC transporter ATP-binding protein [Deltaproteobacteria bacterium]
MCRPQIGGPRASVVYPAVNVGRSDVVLSVSDLKKTFVKPFTRKKVEAVRSVSFEVQRGDIFGFLGPNGAGKTTTIKMLTGLIAPTGGKATIFGEAVPSPEAMGKVGFLPENPYIYPYLTPREFVSLCGRLNGMGGKALATEVERVIERVGIGYAIDRPVRALSKGMVQRTGVAAALIHGPELLILDEPMSGLDPVGRKEIRDLIVEEAEAGRTVFFSSHILSDVEMLCERVCILRKGEVVASGSIDELLGQGARHTEISLLDVNDALADELRAHATTTRRLGKSLVLEVAGDAEAKAVLTKALAGDARVESLTPKRETLEDIFVRKAL